MLCLFCVINTNKLDYKSLIQHVGYNVIPRAAVICKTTSSMRAQRHITKQNLVAMSMIV